MADSINIPEKDLGKLLKLQKSVADARISHSLAVEEQQKKVNAAYKAVVSNEVRVQKFAEGICSELLTTEELENFDWHIDIVSGKIKNLGPVAPK